MSTVEYFENAPVGATATRTNGHRAMKMNDGVRGWITRTGLYLDNEKIAKLGYTLDPSAPTTAREALDIAWELAHPVKEGQVIPEGTRYLTSSGSGLKESTSCVDQKMSPHLASINRTLDPLPDPKPDWLDAPAVLANEPGTGKRGVFVPTDKDTGKHWAVVFSALSYPWQELTDVTPLYPKGQDS